MPVLTSPLLAPASPHAGPASLSGDAEALFAAQATPAHRLPPVHPAATGLAHALLETLAGDRPARQLARVVSPPLLEALEQGRWRLPSRPWAASVRSVHVCQPADGIAEVSAVIVGLERTLRGSIGVEVRRVRAVAMRLEGLDGRWMLTALRVG